MSNVSPSLSANIASLRKPFVIEIHQDRPRPGGSFIPAASLKLGEEFRTSGLLKFLAPEDLKSLLYLLTFVAPEGHCTVSLPILTSAMKASSHTVKSRMRRLSELRWQNQPLIIAVSHESGLYTYSLHPQLVAYEHLTVSEPHSTSPFREVSRPAGSRNRIVEYSRHRYALPRDAVEKIVAQQLGQDSEETDGQRKLRCRLENAGLTSEQAREVLLASDSDVIAQQLDWLPFRHAKNPAGYLLAAIEGKYNEPRGMRERRLDLERQYIASQNDPPGEKWEMEDASSQSFDLDLESIAEQNMDEVELELESGKENGAEKTSPETSPTNRVSFGGDIAALETGEGEITITPDE